VGGRAASVVTLAVLATLGGGGPAVAARFVTQSQALAEAFPGARVERRTFALTPGQARAVEGRAQVRLPSRLITAYPAWRADTLAGTAFFESRTIRTMPGVFMVVVAPDTTITRIEVLAFHEPPDYRPPARWLDGFAGRPLDDRLWPSRDLRNLAGATLSARSVAESARLALALYETVLVPGFAGAKAPREER
jgi:hypothetical protein